MSDDDLDMSGRVVLVTGGGRGVGRGITETFLRRGATAVVCGRTEPDDLATFDGGTPHFVACDVRDPDQVDALVSTIVADHGHLDVLVNNAGGSPPADTTTASPRFHAAIIGLNLIAPMQVAQRAAVAMLAQPDGGSIVNIASVNGVRPSPGTAAYGAAKAGLIHLTTTLAVEWAPRIRVNCVTSGIVATDDIVRVHYGDDPARIEAIAAGIPMGRLGSPSDIGNACLFLASGLAAHVTGANLVVHGGGEPAESSRSGATDPGAATKEA